MKESIRQAILKQLDMQDRQKKSEKDRAMTEELLDKAVYQSDRKSVV